MSRRRRRGRCRWLCRGFGALWGGKGRSIPHHLVHKLRRTVEIWGIRTPDTIDSIRSLRVIRHQIIGRGFRARIRPHLSAALPFWYVEACDTHEAICPELVGSACFVGFVGGVPFCHPVCHIQGVIACGVEAVVYDVFAVEDGGVCGGAACAGGLRLTAFEGERGAGEVGECVGEGEESGEEDDG